jgi:RNA polymerase sigma-70 factor (ECF subfamily)
MFAVGAASARLALLAAAHLLAGEGSAFAATGLPASPLARLTLSAWPGIRVGLHAAASLSLCGSRGRVCGRIPLLLAVVLALSGLCATDSSANGTCAGTTALAGSPLAFVVALRSTIGIAGVSLVLHVHVHAQVEACEKAVVMVFVVVMMPMMVHLVLHSLEHAEKLLHFVFNLALLRHEHGHFLPHPVHTLALRLAHLLELPAALALTNLLLVLSAGLEFADLLSVDQAVQDDQGQHSAMKVFHDDLHSAGWTIARMWITKLPRRCLRRIRKKSSFHPVSCNARIKLITRQRLAAGLVSPFVPEARVNHEEEHSWIRAAQAGDTRAYGALVDRYWPRVQRWLHGLIQDSQAAEDLTQDVFLKVWGGLPRFQVGTNFRAWLFCIARRCLIDSHRCGRSPDAASLPDGIPESVPGPVSILVARETLALVQQAMERLPLPLREAFLLRTQEELSYADIANVLEATEETVRWRVFKARQTLLQELSDALDPE